MPMETTATLGRALEEDRLAYRVTRMQYVVRELRRRADERRRRDGAVPAPLGLAIQGFEEELTALRARLDAS